ncbi:hypothetical protein FACS189413_08460 [Bacteroidia bacterium]|nr:hypothetical protein FACS189413_08460 [Bacteroidia bacterium]
MSNKDFFIKQYQRLKELSEGKKPLYKDFLKYCGVHKRKLEAEFGQDAYSKLQLECGDTPNKLIMKRTSLEQILDQYGELVRNKGACPVTSDWMHAKLKPSTVGIGKVHGIRWKEMPNIFINSNKDNPLWKDVINILEKDANKNNSDKSNRIFNEIVEKIEDWKPNRKRIIEEGYKIELRNYLEKYFSLEEEAGESNVDLLINKKISKTCY